MRKKRELLSPDLTPVIDIVFILLIFFMVTSVFKKEEVNLLLNLPKLDAKANSVTKKSFDIELNENVIYFNHKRTTLKELSSTLKEFDKSYLINIKIDKKVAYERVLKLFNTLQRNSINNFNLLAEKTNN